MKSESMTPQQMYKRLIALISSIAALLGIQFLFKFTHTEFVANPLYGLGLLLIAGLLGGQIAMLLRLPQLTGFLAAGLICGPSITGLIPEAQVQNFKMVNQLALALIAMQAGCEFTQDMLKSNLRALLWGTLFHILVITSVVTGALFVLRSQIALFDGLSNMQIFWVSLLFGSIAVSKSPAAVVAVLGETKAKGPLSEYALGMVVVLDVVVLILFSAFIMFTKSSFSPVAIISASSIVHLFQEIGVSVAAGAFFGLLIILYLSLIDRHKILFLVAISYGVSAMCDYLHYDTMLVFVVAGVTVTQLSSQSHKMIEAIEELSSITMIVFFATAGASLHLHELSLVWKAVMILFIVRFVATYMSEIVSTWKAKKDKKFFVYGATPFVSQAGLTIGLATVVSQQIPNVGEALATLAIALVTLNEIFGPILFKFGLSKMGEIADQ